MRYLFDRSEAIELECDAVIRRHPSLSDGAEVIRARAGETVPPLAPGHYLISETTAPGEERVRYLGVAGRGYTVMQLTVGSFTSDTFDAVVHANRVPVNYYVNLGQVNDSTFRGYEQDYGDAVYPHLMPNSLSPVDPAFACHDANWDSLDAETIETRLRALDGFWRERGFAPLHGIATYTPSNSLVAAMKRLGWRVLHSVVPEQNWSDGRWAINHWGMPNQPYYISDEDFRKPTVRRDRNVIAMSMNSYHLYMPHVTHWGDNVLSPSHFLRWHRTVESGPEPLRFGNFLRDYLAAAEGREEPFFLIAGFEFGRTFGVRSMTKHNRRGLELVLEAAKRHPVVFATGRDVALYYERHQLAQPEAVFTQRDYLAGTRIMDKPVNSGPSIGMEMHAYKAVFAHLEPLPFYHYDYLEPWHYRADDTAVPRDYVESDRAAVEVRRSGDVLTLRAAKPLERAVPVAVWDGEIAGDRPGRVFQPPQLDDGRTHTVLELPAGWHGECVLAVRNVSEPPAAEFAGSDHPAWRVQRIGGHCYLYLDFPATRPFEIDWQAPAACRIDAPDRVLGGFAAGESVRLAFNARRLWYRFHGLAPEAIRPGGDAMRKLSAEQRESERFFAEARRDLPRDRRELDEWFAAQLPAGEHVELELDCFGDNVFGERSRARPFDRIVRRGKAALRAEELSDGGISLGHGRSFWVHPRSLHFEIAGLETLASADGRFTLTLFTRTPKEEAKPFRYRLRIQHRGRLVAEFPAWVCPYDCSEGALLQVRLPLDAFPDGVADCHLAADQRGVLDDWYREGGFIAALERLAVTCR